MCIGGGGVVEGVGGAVLLTVLVTICAIPYSLRY